MLPFAALLTLVDVSPQSASAAVPHPPLRATPRNSPADWITDEDYPGSSLRNNEQGVVGFALAIDATGVVTGCTITLSSGWTALDAATCRLLQQRARFNPAKDRDGEAIADSFRFRIRWSMPDGGNSPFESWTRFTQFRTNSLGVLSGCTDRHEGAPPEGGFGGCVRQPKEIGELADRGLVTLIEVHHLADTSAPKFEMPAGSILSDREVEMEISPAGYVSKCIVRYQMGPQSDVPCAPLWHYPVRGGPQPVTVRFRQTLVSDTSTHKTP